MKKSFFIFLICLTACIKEEKAPAGTIPQDSMARIITDILISESKVASQNYPVDSSYFYYEVYKRRTYKKYNISTERFQKSMEYYMRNTKEYDKIMEVVIDSLGLKESRGRLD